MNLILLLSKHRISPMNYATCGLFFIFDYKQMDSLQAKNSLDQFESSERTEKMKHTGSLFGLAFQARSMIDMQRLATNQRTGGLRSSNLLVEIEENRIGTIDWTDVLNQREHSTQLLSEPYQIFQKRMM